MSYAYVGGAERHVQIGTEEAARAPASNFDDDDDDDKGINGCRDVLQ